MINNEIIFISAVRYALGRRTYIVGITCEEVRRELPNLSKNCIDVMINDIESQMIFPNGLGDECDEDEWMKLHDELSEEYERRNEND